MNDCAECERLREELEAMRTNLTGLAHGILTAVQPSQDS